MKLLNAGLLRPMARCLAAVIAGTAAADVSELPAEICDALYNPDTLDPMQPVGQSACRDFIARNPPPWKIGYASSCAGNTWRAAGMDRLQNKIIPQWQALGLIDEVIITQSNLNDSASSLSLAV